MNQDCWYALNIHVLWFKQTFFERVGWRQTICVCVCVCLLLAKIYILASMFVWRFVCLSVCLSVCLFVGLKCWRYWSHRSINTKLGTYMYLGSGYMCIVFGVDDVTNDVIRLKNGSNFEIVTTPSIFLARTWIKSSKCRACSWLSCWCVQFPVTLPTKKFAPVLKFRHFEFFWNIQYSFNLT